MRLGMSKGSQASQAFVKRERGRLLGQLAQKRTHRRVPLAYSGFANSSDRFCLFLATETPAPFEKRRVIGN